MRVDIPVDAEGARAELARLVTTNPVSFAALSKMLGRNAAYLHQYIKRGTPQHLEQRDRKLLANFFGIDEARLGPPSNETTSARLVSVPKLDVRPSAGPGSAAGNEDVLTSYDFDRRFLRDMGQTDPARLSIVRVRGDSMVPTLADGDDILVSATEGEALPDGIYVIERDDALIVKRLSRNPSSGLFTISSDNPAHPSWNECRLDSMRIIGRVAWIMRKVA